MGFLLKYDGISVTSSGSYHNTKLHQHNHSDLLKHSNPYKNYNFPQNMEIFQLLHPARAKIRNYASGIIRPLSLHQQNPPSRAKIRNYNRKSIQLISKYGILEHGNSYTQTTFVFLQWHIVVSVSMNIIALRHWRPSLIFFCWEVSWGKHYSERIKRRTRKVLSNRKHD